MSATGYEKIFAGRPAGDLIGRDSELARLVSQSMSGSGMLLLAEPGAGASELLRQTYDRLFHTQQQIIPVYFPVRTTFRTGAELAENFLSDFLHQMIAFRRREPSIVRSAVGLDELRELSLSVSGIWIDRMLELAGSGPVSRDFVRSCLGAPVRAAIHSARSFVMIDDAHDLLDLENGRGLLDELVNIFSGGNLSFVISGRRRVLHGLIDAPQLELAGLEFEEAGVLVQMLADKSGVTLSEQARDLIAAQFSGNPVLTNLLIREAANAGRRLESFTDVENVYADSIFGGRMAARFDSHLITACATAAHSEKNILNALSAVQNSEGSRMPIEYWTRRLQIGPGEAELLLRRLHQAEFVRATSTHVEMMNENIVVNDYIETRCRLSSADSRAPVFGDSLTAFIKRAPELLARQYRADSSIGVRDILAAFDGRSVATLLVDYGEFRDEFKAAPDVEVFDAARDSEKIALPRIFFTTSASSFYKPLSQIAESERAAIALGFEAFDEDANREIVWIAAEIDSKLEASREAAEFWCDRLEVAAAMCKFEAFKIWLIAREGFSPEALEVLKRRNAYGSSRRQTDLLRRVLNAPKRSADDLARNEYEIVIPMDEDSEMIAAHAVEEISRRHKLDSKSINQIKTALVEACINATEHSLSPDRKIYQRFRIEDDRVVLTVSNRGLRLTPSKVTAAEPDEGRRGWGLKLMRRLMDEVSIEDVDDGTRIVMTKYLSAA
jgi:serine/threonine-protein kinase RsbW